MYCIDYCETYVPVVEYTAVRCLLCIVAHLDLELPQKDVVTAFLNGVVEGDIYKEVPEGAPDLNRAETICKL